MLKIVVLISGKGTNLKALHESSCSEASPLYSISAVISDKEQAEGLAYARSVGIETHTLLPPASGLSYDKQLQLLFSQLDLQLICLAGYMRVLGEELIKACPYPILNIHPSLLPAFPGLNTHQRALEKRVKIHGCTVHLVNTQLDSGLIIAQTAVPVLSGDTAETLSQRVLEEEHRLYPAVVKAIANQTLVLDKDSATFLSIQKRQTYRTLSSIY